jgi:D-beta-D-heptose 7-phosphate kinase/D-beta-D-heptose 1-phosphate adenosyltransferase
MIAGTVRYAPWRAEPIWPAELLIRCLAGHRGAGHRIVFTNGCFDVLHRGHVQYLQQAAALGDVLAVAVNSDAAVRRLKGQGRPLNPADDRAAVVAALGCVEYVTVFDEDTPARLLEAIRPDVYVKGGDYDAAALPERHLVERHGGRVVIAGYLPGRSTSHLLRRMRHGATLSA